MDVGKKNPINRGHQAPRESKVKIATCNAQALFSPDDLSEDSWAEPKTAEDSFALARQLQYTEADIISLQECGSEKTVKDFLADTGLSKKYPHVAHLPAKYEKNGLALAVISKYPFKKIVNHQPDIPMADGSGVTTLARGLLRVDVELPDQIVTVYDAHSKSRKQSGPKKSDSELRRLSEAQAIRQIVSQEMKPYPNRFFVVTGDLNDGSTDPSVQALLNPADAKPWQDSLSHLPESEQKTWPADPNYVTEHAPIQLDHIIFDPKRAKLAKSQTLAGSGTDHRLIEAEFNLVDK